MAVINPGFMSIIIADYIDCAVKNAKKFIFLTKSRRYCCVQAATVPAVA